MSESKKYLENFLYSYNNLFEKTDDGDLIFKDNNDYVDFLNNYGLINTSKDNYNKINFFKENVNKLLSLPKNDKNSIWLIDNICKIKTVFAQIQTDLTVPDQGHYMYKNYEYKQGISASAYLMLFLVKIKNNETEKLCKFGEECKRCNPIHFKEFYHPRNSKLPNSQKTLKIQKTISRNDSYHPFKKGGKKTKKFSKNNSKRRVEMITNDFIYNVTKTNNSKSLNNQFCNNGYLIATLSRKTRRKTKHGDMKEYFDYLAKLKGISVLSKHYHIEKISKNVYLNEATVKWKWDAIKKPIVARMTFIIKNKCIFLLHSSGLPKLNRNIK